MPFQVKAGATFAIVAIEGSPDLNVLINHNHPDAGAITVAHVEPFTLDGACSARDEAIRSEAASGSAA